MITRFRSSPGFCVPLAILVGLIMLGGAGYAMAVDPIYSNSSYSFSVPSGWMLFAGKELDDLREKTPVLFGLDLSRMDCILARDGFRPYSIIAARLIPTKRVSERELRSVVESKELENTLLGGLGRETYQVIPGGTTYDSKNRIQYIHFIENNRVVYKIAIVLTNQGAIWLTLITPEPRTDTADFDRMISGLKVASPLVYRPSFQESIENVLPLKSYSESVSGAVAWCVAGVLASLVSRLLAWVPPARQALIRAYRYRYFVSVGMWLGWIVIARQVFYPGNLELLTGFLFAGSLLLRMWVLARFDREKGELQS